MYNLIEYSSNYFDMASSLRFYSKDEATNFDKDIVNDNAFQYFVYKTKLLGNTEIDETNKILKWTETLMDEILCFSFSYNWWW